MTNPDDLLAAILADPANDDLRLVYADLLDDRGEGERAEFIRLQIKLIDHPKHHTADSGCRFRRRERELLNACGWSWVTNLEGEDGGTKDMIVANGNKINFTWSRGFIAEVRLSCQEWLAHGPALVRRQPIVKCVLTDRKPLHGGSATCAWFGDETGVSYHYLPTPIYELLDGWESATNIGVKIKRYPTDASAVEALSRAAIAWAKSKPKGGYR